MKKRKNLDNYEKRPIDRIINGSFYLLWGFFLLVCALLLFATKGHCATVSENPLPYIVVNENISGYDDFVNGLRFNGGYSWAVNQIDNDNFFGYDYFESGYHKFCFYFPADDFEYSFALSEDYEEFDMTSDTCQMTIRNYTYISGRFDVYNGRYYFYGVAGNTKITQNNTITFFANSNKGDGNLLVPNISSQNYLYNDNEYEVVFGFGNPERPIIPTGHATPPHEFESPIYTQGHSKPANVPQLTINHYTWTNTPTLDLSTLENAVNSIYNYQTWLGENLKNMLTNIVNNIQNLGQYIGETIQYYGNLIVSNIQNMIQTFYNNMVSLGESVAQAIDYISQPLDVEQITDYIETTTIMTDIVSVKTLATTAFNIYGTVNEPLAFTIPLDLTGIAILHQTQPFYIDLGWLNSAKSYIRAFMWCFVTFGLLYSIVIDIPNIIKSSK